MEALDLEEELAEDGAFYGAPYFVNDAANFVPRSEADAYRCLLYTSDAADEEDSVDLGGRRIIKKKKK